MTVYQQLAVERAVLDALLENYGREIRVPRCLTDEGWLRHHIGNMLFVMQKARVDALAQCLQEELSNADLP